MKPLASSSWFAALALLVVVAACGACQQAGGKSERGPGAAAHECLPLASIGPDKCPPTWTDALADKSRFCAESHGPGFDAFTSKAACRGALRYTRHLFDGGPRFCIYDPATLALRGHRAVDPKVLSEQISCGVSAADFGDDRCDGESCPTSVK